MVAAEGSNRSWEALLREPAETPRASGRYAGRLRAFLASTGSERLDGNLYLGRAGELLVTAELLRLGLNAAPLPVDTGIDILAHRILRMGVPLAQAEHEIYQFQVKTTATSEYRASLPVDKVHELWHNTINLMIVFWKQAAAPRVLVVPPSLIFMLTSGGFEDPKAPLVLSGERVTLRFIERSGRFFIRNRHNDISSMESRFDRIEPVGTGTGLMPAYACWSDGKGLVALDEE